MSKEIGTKGKILVNSELIIFVYLLNFFICFIGWEIWMSLGIVQPSDSYTKRIGIVGNNKYLFYKNILNSFEMSFLDGFIGVIQILSAIKLYGKTILKKWNINAFNIIFILGILQNIIITLLFRGRLLYNSDDKDISIAPLMPIKSYNYIQIQEAWVIQPFILYPLLIYFNNIFYNLGLGLLISNI